MRVNLYITYCSLLFTTLISSCFLFYVVAQENAKYVANTAAGGGVAAPAAASDVVVDSLMPNKHDNAAANENNNNADAGGADIGNGKAAAALPPPPLNGQQQHEEEILPNYKKVHKLPNDGENVHPDVSSDIKKVQISDDRGEGRARPSLSSESGDAKSIASDDSVIIISQNEMSSSEVPREKSEDEEQMLIHTKTTTTASNTENTQAKIVEQSEEERSVNAKERDSGLPNIQEIPTVTVSELPLEIFDPAASTLDSIIIGSGGDSLRDPENITVDILENSNEAMQKDEQIIKINDSGGGAPAAAAIIGSPEVSPEDGNIPSVNATAAGDPMPVDGSGHGGELVVDSTTAPSGINLTAEEVPMPVFSEWAQKQMEAAEKQQALEQDVVNTSTLKKNSTNGNGRQAQIKLRSKNYASPDCGAKIIAANGDASNTAAVLNSQKDEYMLSPCGNRIWFVVELCEAIQAQRIDLANFELFSSSPKNFTVAVSNRFPTRDWSNVGRFIAEDKRTVQTFDLHPHLFGKFVRVDIHSHYSKEHFCPVSLFRVFGTSEFEAFETDQHDDMDDFDDDFVAQELALGKNPDTNLFKSASDAVFSIMKKAAEVLVKPVNHLNHSLAASSQSGYCWTRIAGQFNCPDCNQTFVEQVNSLLACESRTLDSLMSLEVLRNDLVGSQVCSTRFGFSILNSKVSRTNPVSHAFAMDFKKSFFINILPQQYIGALCQLMMETQLQNGGYPASVAVTEKDDASEVPLNLTINKKPKANEFEIIGERDKTPPPQTNDNERVVQLEPQVVEPSVTTEPGFVDSPQLAKPVTQGDPGDFSGEATTAAPSPIKETAPDVNIFNVPEINSDEFEDPSWSAQPEASGEEATASTESPPTTTAAPPSTTMPGATTTPTPNNAAMASPSPTGAPPASATPTPTPATLPPVPTTSATPPAPKLDEDPASWDSFENLLTSTVAPQVGGGGGSAGFNAGNSVQHKTASSPQSESVFIRLSNRIKALERNMSLSGQYLEELSRRYKKQVEELQVTLTQQTQTVRSLEQQIRHQNDMEQVYAESNAHLKRELNDLTLQVHACIVVTVVVGVLVMLIFLCGFIYYRKMHRQTLEMLLAKNLKRSNCAAPPAGTGTAAAKRLNRRKSYEDFSEHQRSLAVVGEGGAVGGGGGGEKMRRPSEEASLLVLNGLRDSAEESLAKGGSAQLRQRKISVCYGAANGAGENAFSKSNLSAGGGDDVGVTNVNKGQAGKRKGEKHSWPNTGHGMQHAWQRLEQLDEYVHGEEYGQQPLGLPPINGKAKRKANLNLKRQESAPSAASYVAPRLNVTAPAELDCSLNTSVSYDESLILDDDDLDNFIPTADLAYNEFMPEGPSGYLLSNDETDGAPKATDAKAKSKAGKKVAGAPASTAAAATEKKTRRLSSPAFFKSPFAKNLKGKRLTASLASSSSSSNASQNPSKAHHSNIVSSKSTPHESTSWEWYRLSRNSKSADAKHLNTSSSATNFMSAASSHSPNASVDSSSLSEINFPTNYTDNSFRILEEAILTSGESLAKATKGRGGPVETNHGSSSSGADSNRSSTSSAGKKKSRTFNKIFRKVF